MKHFGAFSRIVWASESVTVTHHERKTTENVLMPKHAVFAFL